MDPIPYPENKPQPEDLNSDGKCWFFLEIDPRWVLMTPNSLMTVSAQYFLPFNSIKNMSGIKSKFIENKLKVNRKFKQKNIENTHKSYWSNHFRSQF